MSPRDPREIIAEVLGDAEVGNRDRGVLTPDLVAEAVDQALTDAHLAAALGPLNAQATADHVIQALTAQRTSRRHRVAGRVVSHMASRKASHEARRVRRRSKPLSWLVGVAAAAVVLILLGMYVGPNHSAHSEPGMASAELTFDVGMHTLPDGSQFTIQRGSVHWNAALSAWELHDGAVTAQVTPQGPAGFHVQTPVLRVSVVGTQFHVQHDAHGSRVSVSEGVVQVAAVTKEKPSVEKPGAEKSSAEKSWKLGPGDWCQSDGVTWRQGFSWQSPAAAPHFMTAGRLVEGNLEGTLFPDGFGSLGVELRPVAWSITATTVVRLRYQLSTDSPVLGVWARCADGSAFAWEKTAPTTSSWENISIPVQDFLPQSNLPGTLVGRTITWLHVTTRAAPGRILRLATLAIEEP